MNSFYLEVFRLESPPAKINMNMKTIIHTIAMVGNTDISIILTPSNAIIVHIRATTCNNISIN